MCFLCDQGIKRRKMNKVFILLGGNSGDKKKNLSIAAKHIAVRVGKIEKRSSLYETEAWGMNEQPSFLNQVLRVLTQKNALQVLGLILDIEQKMGRKRIEKWEARIIDIDILFFNEEIIHEEDLIIPHPFIQDRRFTLVPLNEIAPDLMHPLYHKNINELLRVCSDQMGVQKCPPD